MSYIRIIPCLDVASQRVVKGREFVNLVDAGDPIALAQRYDAEGADELTFLDITATNESRATAGELAHRVAQTVGIPFTLGGGISDLTHAQQLIRAGADKVSLNSAAVSNPSLISSLASAVGSQSVVVAIDAKRVDNAYVVMTHGGTRRTSLEVTSWAREVVDRGAGELLITSMDKDGTKSGYAIELYRKVTSAVTVPVIASGGAGSPDDFVEVVREGGVHAILAASIFHHHLYTIADIKDALTAAGISVRPPRLSTPIQGGSRAQ